MATVIAITNNIPVNGADGLAKAFTWLCTAIADTGSQVSMPNAKFASVQITGTFGTATISLEGSNDGVNWTALKDGANALITGIAAATVLSVSSKALFYRANTSGTPTSISVSLFLSA